MNFFGKTDVGMMRKVNQDSFRCLSIWGGEAVLLVVCDGMGGHRAGEIASKKAIAEFTDRIITHPCLSESFKAQFEEIRHTMISAAKKANELVLDMSNKLDELSGMGTTLVAGIIFREKLFCLNIGDSRLYVISKNGADQITHDHSFVQSLIDFGQISSEEAKTYPRKNVITQAVGITSEAAADFFCVDIKKKYGSGYVLLCSDGLSNYVDEQVMFDILYGQTQSSEEEADLSDAAEKLVDFANADGGADNITVVLASF